MGKGDMLMGLLKRDHLHARASQNPPPKGVTHKRITWRYYALTILLCLLGTVIVMLVFGPPPPLEIAGIVITVTVIAYIIQSN